MEPDDSVAYDPTMTWALSGDGEVLRTIAPTVSEVPAPAEREPLPDRYEDLGFLDRGGMSELRRVRDSVLGAELAMKLLAWKYLDDD